MTAAEPERAARRFPGFPAGARATAVPSVFFTELMPEIDNADELRVTLYAIYALGRRKGFPRFVTENELAAEAPLMASLSDCDADPSRVHLHRALSAAVDRGALLRLDVEAEGARHALYFLNTPSDRRAVEQIRVGAIEAGRRLPAKSEPPAPARRNVYQLYEENIGALTPLVAEELKEAEELYPFEWLEEAFREAAVLNKRSWRYASRILQRWATEGRKSEKTGRDLAADDPRARIIRRFDSLSGD